MTVGKLFFEDYELGEFFVSPGRTITETDIVLFSAFTGDWHPLHTDVEYASKTPFQGRITHGFLVPVGTVCCPAKKLYSFLWNRVCPLCCTGANRRYDPS